MEVTSYSANCIPTWLRLVLDWLRREAPDILCLQETEAKDKGFPFVARFVLRERMSCNTHLDKQGGRG
jgi:exonuclease III